jgi:hypothetical protein
MTNTGTSALTATHSLMTAAMQAHPGLTTQQAAAWVLDKMATERPELLGKVFAGLMAEMV